MPRLEDVLAALAATPGARAVALAGFDGLLVDEASQGTEPQTPAADLDGAVVELTHAWNAVSRASREHLAGGAPRELVVVCAGGVALSHAVGDAWFALVWADPDVDVAAARSALAAAAAELAEVVA